MLLGNIVTAQTNDSLINVGNHKLNFSILPGRGMPIIFESGGGNDGTVWKEVIALVNQKIKTPLIAYDRAGFGKSGIDTTQINISKEVINLENALHQLNLDNRYFFVAHSLGGNYAMKFISNNPTKVKGAVFIDIVSPKFMDEKRALYTKNLFIDSLEQIKKESIGFYHLVLNYENTSEVMRNVASSIETPLTIIASGLTPFEGNDRTLFLSGLKQFSEQRKNRKYILVEKAEHYVFYDEPILVADEIIRLYNLVNSEN
ncbi:alpha/beta hydrolase [Sphingobacterium sp. KU25419]|nr:alpha/beta hydrolase [Sphingobacterium sp. KU25419]